MSRTRGNAPVTLHVTGPYNFRLSLRVARSFTPEVDIDASNSLRVALRLGRKPALIEVRPTRRGTLEIVTPAGSERDRRRLVGLVEWMLFADLDVRPFYEVANRDTTLAAVVKRLFGVKPMRPPSLFEMAIIAITEQQISMAAAHRIRARLVERFGETVGDWWVFPEPNVLANATMRQLMACGLSRQKADYIRRCAQGVIDGSFDLDALRSLSDDEVRAAIVAQRGFGPWSANYILVRGFARPNCVPVDDLGIRTVVGKYLGGGQRLSAAEVAEKLEPFAPYRGLVAFYLLADNRLNASAR